ncbi:MAG: VOC family protein [Pirellulales bacterium]
MAGVLEQAWGYQGDCLQLPVLDLEAALPFYEMRLGFRVVSRDATPCQRAVLGRDQVQIGLAENGGDPSQDGCAFQVAGLEQLHAEFRSQGLDRELSEFRSEVRQGALWKVFFVVAPDGLCYWFGERQGLEMPGAKRVATD